MEQRIKRLLEDAQRAIQSNRITSADIAVRKILKQQANQIDALILKGQIEQAQLQFDLAFNTWQILLQRSDLSMNQLDSLINLCNQFELNFLLVTALQKHLQIDPNNTQIRFQLSLACAQTGQINKSIALARQCEEQGFTDAQLNLNQGHNYKATGETKLASEYYQKYIENDPEMAGTGYWSLADLKQYRFSASELDQMIAHERRYATLLSDKQKGMLAMAIGRALEQHRNYHQAFEYYTLGNKLLSQSRPFKAQAYQHLITMMKQIQLSETVCENSPLTPIFIVGMPRSGTTLSEQILASHSQVECTDELAFIERIAIQMSQGRSYTEGLFGLTNEKKARFKDFYLKQVKQYIGDHQGLFIDKNPTNFLHIGLICTLFPNAKIIALLRDPIDNGMSVYKQHFSRGNDFSYSLNGIITYQKGYLELLSHWQQQLPDNLYCLSYRRLVEQPEQQIKQLLDFCNLPFEPQCLTFYQSDRPVLTPSATQVRQPINKQALNSACNFTENLQPYNGVFESLSQQMEKLVINCE